MITTINRAIAKKNDGNDKGFTLIELLVVILIIGVLAAIAIPAFLNQREGAWKAQVETDVKNAALAIETEIVKNNGKLPAAAANMNTGPNGAGVGGFRGTTDVTVKYEPGTGRDYKLIGTHSEVVTNPVTSVTFENSTGKTGFTGKWEPTKPATP